MANTDKKPISTGKKTKRGTKTSAIKAFKRHEINIMGYLQKYREAMEQDQDQNNDKDALKQIR